MKNYIKPTTLLESLLCDIKMEGPMLETSGQTPGPGGENTTIEAPRRL